jgi:hypothetical protein
MVVFTTEVVSTALGEEIRDEAMKGFLGTFTLWE